MGVFKIVMEALGAFGRKTSIAGLNNAANSSSSIRRFIWMSIFLVLMVLTVQSFVNTVIDYLSFPILTTVNVTRMSNLPFPAITICNINRIHCTNLLDVQLEEARKYAEDPSEERNTTLTHLNSLMELTGCRLQVCKSLLFLVGPVRLGELGSPSDLGILAFAELGCTSDKDLKMRHCYFVKSIEEESFDKNMTALYNRSLQAFTSLNCELGHACMYSLGSGIPPSAMKAFTSPKSCDKTKKYNTTKEPSFSFEDRYNIKPLMEEESKFFSSYFKLSQNLRTAVGHSFRSKNYYIHGYTVRNRGFMVSCLYRGETCMNVSSYWRTVNLPRYGNCFTFNSMDQQHPKLKATSLTGEANGVSISFFIDQDNYILSRLSEKAGIRIIIHESGSVPLPDEDGIDLHPGTSMSVATQMNQLLSSYETKKLGSLSNTFYLNEYIFKISYKSDIIRLPSPYTSKCFSNWSQTPYENFTRQHPSYSNAVCRNICLQLRLQERCGCVHPYINELTGTDGRKACNIMPSNSTESDFQCFQRFIETFNSYILECKCNVACREINYFLQVTSSSWPSDNFWEGLGAEFGLIPKMMLPLPSSEKQENQIKIQRDFARTDIYFKTLSVKITEELAKYSEESFVSGLGGTMSLYLGIAIIMIFEILELIFDILSGIGSHILGGRHGGRKKGSINAMK